MGCNDHDDGELFVPGRVAGRADAMCSPAPYHSQLIAAVKSGRLLHGYAILEKMQASVVELPCGMLDGQDEREGGTALYWASCFGYEEFAGILIGLGADVLVTNGWQATPLHAASDNNHIAVCRLLLKNKADVNAQTIQGDTPCHLAAYRGNTDVVNLLLEEGADVHICNRQGKTSLQEARANGHIGTVWILQKYSDLRSMDGFSRSSVDRRGYHNTNRRHTCDNCHVVPSNSKYRELSNMCSNRKTATRNSEPFSSLSPYLKASQKTMTADLPRRASEPISGSSKLDDRFDVNNTWEDDNTFSQPDYSDYDVSVNYNSVDYGLMKEKRYNKEKIILK